MKYCFLIWAVVLISTSAHALNFLPTRGLYKVEVKTYKEQRFGEVFRQQYDFSCGSAALASLLTYHYQTPSEEEGVFTAMFEKGDKERIEREGFSLLDMKLYLDSAGFSSDGFRLSLNKVKKVGVPGITLVNYDGYMHFVVVKGINSEFVIIGDPSRGTVKMPIEKFEQYYQGIILLVKNHAEKGKASFVVDENFAIYTPSPVESAILRDSLGVFSTSLREAGEY
jgi:predicted double-glycine peptidase